MEPIWKDYTVSLGSADKVDYRIYTEPGGELVYAGTSYKKPGAAANEIKINEICRDYLRNVLTIPKVGETCVLFPDYNIQSFTVKNMTEETPGGHTYSFVRDWSYDRARAFDPEDAAAPINSILDPRQPIFYSVYRSDGLEFQSTFSDGTSATDKVILKAPYGLVAGNVLPSLLATGQEVVKLRVGERTWDVKKTCARYMLIYVNAFGGWDTFVLADASTENAAYTRAQYEQAYDNTDPTARGKTDYLNEIKRSWTLYTPYLTDEQSRRLELHLLRSVDVYLYDLTTAETIPIVLTDKSAEIKSFKNQGRKLVTYTIKCEASQQMERR